MIIYIKYGIIIIYKGVDFIQLNVKMWETVGLDFVNVPSSIAVLNSFTSKMFNAVWLLQDKILPSIKVETKYNNIKNCSFAMIGSSLYHVVGIDMINENVAQVNLVLEPINTIGLNNISNITGFCRRVLPTDDTFLNNVLPEPFQPAYPLLNEFEEIRIQKDVYNIIAMTVSLSFDMAKPGIDPIPAYTVIKNGVWDKGEKVDTSMVGIALYLYDEKYQSREKLNYLHKMGLTNSILASYQLPKQFVSFMDYDKSTGFIKSMWSTGFGFTSKHKAFYGIPVKNNKVYASQYNYLTVTSSVTGDSKTFKPEEIYSEWQKNGYGMNVFSDLTATGKPFCRPSRYYNENRDDNTWCFAMVNGGNWINNPLTFFNSVGWGWAEQNLNNNIQRGSLESKFLIDQTNAQNQFRDEVTSWSNDLVGFDESAALLERQQAIDLGNFETGVGYDLTLGNIAAGVKKVYEEFRGGLEGQSHTFPNGETYTQQGRDSSNRTFSSTVNRQNLLEQQNMLQKNQVQDMYRRVQAPRFSGQKAFNQAQGSFDKSMNTLSLSKATALISNAQFGAKIQFNALKQGVAPTLMYPTNTGLSLFTKNSFFVIQTRLDNKDIQRFDKFLSLYGYTSNEYISMDMLTNYTNYNYVEFIVDNIFTTTKVPIYLTQLLKNVLTVGVRLWHTKPTPDAYKTNVKG